MTFNRDELVHEDKDHPNDPSKRFVKWIHAGNMQRHVQTKGLRNLTRKYLYGKDQPSNHHTNDGMDRPETKPTTTTTTTTATTTTTTTTTTITSTLNQSTTTSLLPSPTIQRNERTMVDPSSPSSQEQYHHLYGIQSSSFSSAYYFSYPWESLPTIGSMIELSSIQSTSEDRSAQEDHYYHRDTFYVPPSTDYPPGLSDIMEVGSEEGGGGVAGGGGGGGGGGGIQNGVLC